VTEVIIIGAGPYGLSIAAHLGSRGVDFRIFGRTMFNWRAKMPQGMLLKSDPYASNLSDPGAEFTLEKYCLREGLPYHEDAIRVSVEKFVAYGEAFRQQFVPAVDERLVVAVERTANGFSAALEDGEIVMARKVVVAVGISDFPYVPPVLAQIPDGYMSHAAQHNDMAAFADREVAIIGAGSSAVDLAALLHENGASVRIVARRSLVQFHGRADLHGRPLLARLQSPNTGIGPGWRNVLYTAMPHLFRRLPQRLRLRIITNEHGPAGGWFMRDRVVGKIAMLEGLAPRAAEVKDGRVQLHLAGQDGVQQTIAADHVIAATGYKVDVRAIKFLAPPLCRQIELIGQAPLLSHHFESSVAGLYFVGPAAAASFGPMFRFVLGAEYTAPRIAGHLAASLGRRPAARGSSLAVGGWGKEPNAAAAQPAELQ
jgi:cation diffusion facilitator CzcD-associated flavoprotein CzcO